MSLYGGIGSNFAFLKETGSVKKERKMTIELIFKIAAVGILVTILGQVLKHSGRERTGISCFSGRSFYCAFLDYSLHQ